MIEKLTEGYSYDCYPVRYKSYSPKAKMKVAGRWQRMNEYGGWENYEHSGTVYPAPIDPAELIDRIAELEAERAKDHAEINLKADFIDATINQLAAKDARIYELEAALAGAHDKALEEAEDIAAKYEGRWRCAAGFHGHVCGAKIIKDAIRAMKGRSHG